MSEKNKPLQGEATTLMMGSATTYPVRLAFCPDDLHEEKRRADEWKAMAGRLAEALLIHVGTKRLAEQHWKRPETDWEKSDNATLKAFNALRAKEKGAG